MLTLRVTRRAASEIERAQQWWVTNRPAAPFAVRDDLQAALGLLLRQPGVGIPVVGNTRLAGVRRLHLRRLGYFLYYRLRRDELVILSIWPSSRGAGPRL